MGEKKVSSFWDQGAGLRRRTLLVAGSSPLAPRPALLYGPSCIEVGFWRRNLLLCSRFKRVPLLTFPPKGLPTCWVPALIGELLLIDGSSECWSICAINRTFAREK